MITMKQIATELNLSRSTVSYALDQRWRAKRICPETRERILHKARELGFRRNHAALSLKTRKTKTIGVIVPTIASDFSYQMLHGVEAVLDDGYTILLGTSACDAAKERRLIQSFEERMVDGLLLIHAGQDENIPLLREIVQRGVPLVQVEHSFAELESDVVEADNEALGYVLTRHLIELGHRQVCFVRSPRIHSGTLARSAGYERAARESGLTPRLLPSLATETDQPRFEFVGGMVSKLLRTTRPPLGIVTNDLVSALGALQATEDAGLRCPQDVSICTTSPVSDSALTDHSPVWRFLRVRFTAAEWSVEEMGRRAASRLMDRLQQPRSEQPPGQRILISVRLAVGNSTTRAEATLQPHCQSSFGPSVARERTL